MHSSKKKRFVEFNDTPTLDNSPRSVRLWSKCPRTDLKKTKRPSKYASANSYFAVDDEMSTARWSVLSALFTPNSTRKNLCSPWCDINVYISCCGSHSQFGQYAESVSTGGATHTSSNESKHLSIGSIAYVFLTVTVFLFFCSI